MRALTVARETLVAAARLATGRRAFWRNRPVSWRSRSSIVFANCRWIVAKGTGKPSTPAVFHPPGSVESRHNLRRSDPFGRVQDNASEKGRAHRRADRGGSGAARLRDGPGRAEGRGHRGDVRLP